jgi:hypothetical protein
MAEIEHAITDAGTNRKVAGEASHARRRMPLVPAVAPEHSAADTGVAAVDRLRGRVRQRWHTGRPGRIVAFRAGIHNGTNYPLTLTDLPGIDRATAADRVAVPRLDSLGPKEARRYVEKVVAICRDSTAGYGPSASVQR